MRSAASTLIGSFWLAYLAGVVVGATAWHWTAAPLVFAVVPLCLVLLRRSTWRND